MILRKIHAFTLVELIIGVAISTLILGAGIAALSSLEKCLLASDQYNTANSDEQRVMDYVARDLRGAYTVSVTSTSATMTIPDYYGGQYDSQGNPTGLPVTPTISNATVVYGSSSNPLTIVYSLSGSNLIRQMNVGSSGSSSKIVISSNVENLAFTYTDNTSTVQYSVTFLPYFQYATTSGTALTANSSLQNATTGTTLTAVVSVRNTRTD